MFWSLLDMPSPNLNGMYAFLNICYCLAYYTPHSKNHKKLYMKDEFKYIFVFFFKMSLELILECRFATLETTKSVSIMNI